MSDPKPGQSAPREFWIRHAPPREGFHSVVTDVSCDPRSANSSQYKFSNSIHVIEYSAYEAVIDKFSAETTKRVELLEKFEAVTKELEAYKKAKAENDERFQLELAEAKAANEREEKYRYGIDRAMLERAIALLKYLDDKGLALETKGD